MKLSKTKVLSVLVIGLFIGTCIMPIISGQQFHSIIDSVEVNDLFESRECSSKMIDVTVFKLCDDNVIRKFRDRISSEDYYDYVEKIRLSSNLDETFKVLQEFGIVSKSMDFNNFLQIMNNKNKIFGFPNNKNNIFNGMVSGPEGFPEFFTKVIFNFNPIIFNFYIPSIFLYAKSEEGGSIETSIQNVGSSSSDLVEIIMVLYLGLLSMAPYIDLNGASFIGFAVYAKPYAFSR